MYNCEVFGGVYAITETSLENCFSLVCLSTVNAKKAFFLLAVERTHLSRGSNSLLSATNRTKKKKVMAALNHIMLQLC